MVNKSITHRPWPNGKRLPLCFFNNLWITRSLTEHKLSWKIPYIFDGSGTLLATVMAAQTHADEQSQRPLSASPIVHIQFLAENALFSTIDFEFACRGYRVSLLKKKICSGKFSSLELSLESPLVLGKYQSETEQTQPLQYLERPSVDQHHLSISTPLVA